jgi:GT2 family glycosyltransferase
VADDGSHDGTADAIRARFPAAYVLALPGPRGQSACRNAGVSALSAPYVAFCDDDSWFEPGALARAAAAFDAHPRLAAAGARVVVEPHGNLDPTCDKMAASPLGRVPGLGAPRVLGFVACAAVVRRSPFLAVGGFHPRYRGGGEEALLAIDLAAAGWELAYLDHVVAHHAPAPGGRPGRTRMQLRNDLWTTWLRRPARRALTRSARLVAGAHPATAAGALADAAGGLPWVLGSRRRVPARLERLLEQLG